MDFVPDIERLGAIFGLATAPAFFLGTIAAFVSLMSSRMAAAVDRLRKLNAASPAEASRPERQHYARILVRRVELLQAAIRMALVAGISATALLALLFVTEFFGFEYAYGAGLLFTVSTLLLGLALFRFAQEAWIGLSEMDHR
jgi:hypothetical protein